MTNLVSRDPIMNMRQLMERFFREPYPSLGDSFEEGTLPVDILEEDNALVVKASVPGVRPEDIDVQLNQGVLSITARHSSEHEERSERYFRRERTFGAVSRRIALPGVVQDAEVQAQLRDGVLTLTLPVPEQRRPKRIEIQSLDSQSGTANGMAPQAIGGSESDAARTTTGATADGQSASERPSDSMRQ